MKEYYKAELFLNKGKNEQEYLMDVIITINEITARCYEICTDEELIYDDVPFSPYYSVIKNITKVSQKEVDDYIINFNCSKFFKAIANGIDTKDGNYSNEYVKEKVKTLSKIK